MVKTLIDINQDILNTARDILGTKTKKDTVHLALEEVVGRERRMRLVERFANEAEPLEEPVVTPVEKTLVTNTMVASQLYLTDTSVWLHVNKPHVKEVFTAKLLQGVIAMCEPVSAELLRKAQSSQHFAEIYDELCDYRWLPTFDDLWERIFFVQEALCQVNNHRPVKLSDLLVAAIAERHQATVLHYDVHFDLIASVTGQSTEWIVTPGTAD